MSYDIIILDQIGNHVHLYINCFKYGYKTLCYFSNNSDLVEVPLTSPEITIENLADTRYYFYCVDKEGNETGHVAISISTVSRTDLYQNILTVSRIDDPIYSEIMSNLKTDQYVTGIMDSKKINDESIRDSLLSTAVTYYNMAQESLNKDNTPSFQFDVNKIKSLSEDLYTFCPYVYNNGKWILEQNKKRTNETEFTLNGKPRNLYLIFVLSDFQIVRKYFIYEPSETASMALYESRIKAKQILKEKTVEAASRYDLSDLMEDEYGQAVVSAIQELKPERPVFKKPEVSYEEDHFSVTVKDRGLVLATGKDIYIGALEIDQAFLPNFVPHRIKVSGETFRFRPEDCFLNNHEDYLFFLCDESNKILSDILPVSYNTDNDIELYIAVSRKIDIEIFRRELFNVFREYDKKDWDMISSYLDGYAMTAENGSSFLEYMVQRIQELNIYQYNPVYLLELVLLTMLKHHMPIDQSFLQEQVYAQGYKKHVFPESSLQYAACVVRINNGSVQYDYLPCGRYAQEIRMDLDDILILYAIDGNNWRCSSIALYNNYNSEENPYFFFPDLEVKVLYGLN